MLNGYFLTSTEEQKNSSELRNLSSEVSFHSSELLFRPSVEKVRFLTGKSEIDRRKRLALETNGAIKTSSPL